MIHQIEISLPESLATLRLPAAVAFRRQQWLEREHSGRPLWESERNEVEGINDVAAVLSLLKQRAARLNPGAFCPNRTHQSMQQLKLYLALSGAVLATLCALVLWKSPHLAFYFSEWNRPTSTVAVEQIEGGLDLSTDWSPIEYNGQMLHVPRFLLAGDPIHADNLATSFGRFDSRWLRIGAPNRGDAIQSRQSDLEAAPVEVPRSVCEENALCYTTSAANFDWRMTQAEVAALKWLLERKHEETDVSRVYLRLEKEWEGILLVSPSQAVFQWHLKNAARVGAVLFRFPDENAPPQWVIDVCRSFDPVASVDWDVSPAIRSQLRVDGTDIEVVREPEAPNGNL